jgi:Uma2 family endonuclease
MAVTDALRKKAPVGERLLTAADLAVFPSELPSGTVRYELDNGRLVIMPPTRDDHGATESNLVAPFKLQGENRGHGKARSGDIGIILWHDPDRVVGADAVFICNSSLPLRYSKEGYLEAIPDLVVEVRRNNDKEVKVSQKVKDYLAAGARVPWLADPRKQIVTEYRPGKKPRVLTAQETLTTEDIIPGFQMPVTEVFQI